MTRYFSERTKERLATAGEFLYGFGSHFVPPLSQVRTQRLYVEVLKNLEDGASELEMAGDLERAAEFREEAKSRRRIRRLALPGAILADVGKIVAVYLTLGYGSTSMPFVYGVISTTEGVSDILVNTQNSLYERERQKRTAGSGGAPSQPAASESTPLPQYLAGARKKEILKPQPA